MIRRTAMLFACLLAATGVQAASAYMAPAEKAVQWLSTQQNADGSWGLSDDEQYLLTSEAVRALAAYQHKNSAYFGGVAWLQNHNPVNIDHQARAILALQPQGESLAGNITFLQDAQNLTVPGNGGWGVSSAYQGAAQDTALVLEAGQLVSGWGDYAQATGFLKGAQLTGADNGWAVGNNTTSNLVATAQVIAALVPYRMTDTTLTTPIANAVATLDAQVTTASPITTQAHAALALLRDNPNSTVALALLDHLALVQSTNGDINGDIYATALALRAMSATMKTDLASQGQRVDITDQNLRASLNDALGRDQMSTLSRGDLAQLTTLDISNQNITDLTGLQFAINLTSLNAQNNLISSTVPLDGLTQLTFLQLQGNPVTAVADGDVPTLPEWAAILMAILLLTSVIRHAARRSPGGYA